MPPSRNTCASLEDQPRDWNTANTLGDLYVRAGQPDKAVAQYTRIADHLVHEGFYPEGGRALQEDPQDQAGRRGSAAAARRALGQAGPAGRRQVLLQRRRRPPAGRAATRLAPTRWSSGSAASIRPTSRARLAAARVLEQSGETIGAAIRFRELHADLLEKNTPGRGARRPARSGAAESRRHGGTRGARARGASRAGDLETARAYLDAETAAGDPALLLALLTIDLRGGCARSTRELIRQLLAADETYQGRVVDTGLVAAASELPDGGVRLHRRGGRCADRGVGSTRAAADLLQAVRRPRAGADSRAAEARRGLRGRRSRVGHVRDAGAAGRRLPGDRPGGRGARDRRGSRRPRAVGAGAHRALPPRAGDAEGVRSRHADRGAAQRPGAVHRDGSFRRSSATDRRRPTPAAAAPRLRPEAESAAAEAPAPRRDTYAAATENLPTRSKSISRPCSAISKDGRTMAPPDPEDLDEALDDFRSAVSSQDGSDEAAQHLKLARTYLEMGMSEEAIGALETAARSPRHRFEAAAMLARLYRNQKDLPRAIEWLERAAEAPAPDTRGRPGAALRPRVGARSDGETARALAVFLELQADAGELSRRRRQNRSALRGSRPEADHQDRQPPAVRCVFPRGGIHSRRRALVRLLGAQSVRGHACGRRSADRQPVRSWGGERRRRHHR